MRHLPSSATASATEASRAMVATSLPLFARIAAIVAVAIVAAGDPGLHIHMLIATALGVFFTVLLGTGLMSLVFLSNSSGHDDEAARSQKDDRP